MRLLTAIVLLAVSTVSISLAIAQQTIFDEPDTFELSIDSGFSGPAVVIHGRELSKFPGRQTISVEGGTSGLVPSRGESGYATDSTERVFVAYGRTLDVLAWMQGARHAQLRIDPESERLLVLPRSGQLYLPDPEGSDLWFVEYAEDEPVSFSLATPEDISILIMSDGRLPAPNLITISWPLGSETPWIVALILVGVISLVAGFLSLFSYWSFLRKYGGPRRRKTRRLRGRMPRPPRRQRVKRPSSIQPRGRRAAQFVALPVAATIVIAGCAGPVSSGGQGVIGSDSEQTSAPYPSVTELQFSKIMGRVANRVSFADEELSIEALRGRLENPSLAARVATYKIREADAESGQLIPIPASPIRLVLPQQTSSWPRHVFGVIQDEADLESPSIGVVLKQENPRAPYKLSYSIILNPQVQLPDLPSANFGAPKLSPESKLTRIPPSELVQRYADVLRRGSDSPYASDFALLNDPLFLQAGPDAEALRQESFGNSVRVTWKSSPGESEVIAFSTADSGAIVMGTIIESELVQPVQSGATVNSSLAVRALTSMSQSEAGFDVKSQLQILWYVPPVGSEGAVRVLGFTYSLIDAMEINSE